jgi:hypothetical protein
VKSEIERVKALAIVLRYRGPSGAQIAFELCQKRGVDARR